MEHGRVFLMWPFKKVWYCHNCHEIFLKFNCQVLTVTYSNWNLESLISYWNMKRKTGELNWNWSPFLRSLGSFFTQLWASQLWSFPMGLPVKHTEILHLSKLSPSRHFQGGRFPGNQFRSGLVPSVADCLFPKKNGGQICNLDFWHKITESSSVPILSPPPQTKEIYITHLLHASSGNVVWDATTGTTTSSCGSMSSTDQIYICSGIPIGRIVQGIHGIEKTIDSEELQEIASTEPKEVYTSSSSTRTLSNMPCHICERCHMRCTLCVPETRFFSPAFRDLKTWRLLYHLGSPQVESYGGFPTSPENCNHWLTGPPGIYETWNGQKIRPGWRIPVNIMWFISSLRFIQVVYQLSKYQWVWRVPLGVGQKYASSQHVWKVQAQSLLPPCKQSIQSQCIETIQVDSNQNDNYIVHLLDIGCAQNVCPSVWNMTPPTLELPDTSRFFWNWLSRTKPQR